MKATAALAGAVRGAFRADVLAGLTTAAVVVPSSMAYASLAGLPVEAGLYTALVALPVYALLGTSPVLSVSVTSTIAVLSAGGIAVVAPTGDRTAAATLALLAGLVLVVAQVLRLGFVTNFISTPVLVGFKAGMGLYIASSQLGNVLGIAIPRGGFFHNVWEAVRHLGSAHWRTVVLAATTIALMAVLARIVPVVPAALAAVVFGIGAQAVFDLESHGVVLVGTIPSGLPSLALPTFAHTADLFPAALGIALMSAIESNSSARAFARPDARRLRANREWLALGAANVAVSFVRGLPAGGGTSQTAVNARAGARTRVAGLVTAVVVALALTLLASTFSDMPEATLGAIVLVAAAGLVQPQELRRIYEVRRRDAVLGLVALVSVVLLGPLKGILAAVVLSMLTLLFEATRPPVTSRYERGILVVKPEGGIYFANADHVYDAILDVVDREHGPAVLVLDGSAIPELEYTGLEIIFRLGRKLGQRGIELRIAALNERPRAMLAARAGDEHSIRLFESVDDALEPTGTVAP